MGVHYGRAVRSSQGDPSTHARREWCPRRNDSCPEFLLARREPRECRPLDLPGLWTRLLISVSRILHETSSRFSRLRVCCCALLNPGPVPLIEAPVDAYRIPAQILPPGAGATRGYRVIAHDRRGHGALYTDSYRQRDGHVCSGRRAVGGAP